MSAIRLTVHPGEDVLLPAGVSLDALREPLADLLRRPELRHATLWAEGIEIAPGSVVGERPLLPGTTVRADDGGWRHGDPPSSGGARGGVAAAWSDDEALRSAWLVARTTGAEAGELAGLGARTRLELPGGVRVRVTGRGAVRVRVLVVRRTEASGVGLPDGRRRAGRWASGVGPHHGGPRAGGPASRIGPHHGGPRAGRPPSDIEPHEGGPRTGRPPRVTLIRAGKAKPRRVRPWGRRWRPGDVLEAGACYTLHRSGDAAALLDGLREAALPAPSRERGTGLAALLATALVPAAGSIGLAVALRQPTFALFAALGLMTAIPQVVTALRRRREAPASTPVSEPRPRPGVRGPDVLARAVLGAVHASEPSWRDALRATARPPSAFPVPGGTTDGQQHRTLLPDGALAVRGPDLAAAAVARAVVAGLVAQGATVRVAGAGRDRWAWCRWLDGGTLAADRPSSVALDGGGTVLVADAPSSTGLDVGQAAHRAGADVVLCLPQGAVVPSWCRGVLDVVQTPRGVTQVRHAQPDGGTTIGPLIGVSDTWAERFARRLAGIRALGRDVGTLWSPTDSTTRGSNLPVGADPVDPRLPDVVPLAGIVDAPASDWAVPLGVGADGRVVTFDLVDDGPHLLVAGTTGAGKSELLQALVLALALRRTPADLALALIDFKGGASFGACADLPHVVGQVTDLDPGLAARALEGLRAELRRRKQVLAVHGVADVVALPPGTLPRLVVVVDEFRALADDLPDLLPGLLRVAAQGRSLGVHLVLATQRPAGAVSADVRANVSARIALRVVDAADSHDVLDSPAAARIPAGVPGRAVLRVGAQTPVALQCAYAGAAPPAATAPVRRAPTWSDAGTLRQRAGARGASGAEIGGTGVGGPRHRGSGDDASSVVATLVGRARAAAAQSVTPRWPTPWLPPLPQVVQVREVAPVPRGALPLALGDSPSTQSRVPVAWDPAAGHLAILGRTRTGRSTTLRTLASAALARGWHVHALVAASAAAEFEHLISHPGFGTLAGPADPRRAARLLRLLHAVPESPAPTLVLVDGIEELRSALASPVDDPLGSALATGAAAFAVTAESAALGGLSARFGPRLVLLSADAGADAMLGAPSVWAGRGRIPGRAVWLAGADPLECQVALPGTTSASAPATASASASASEDDAALHPREAHEAHVFASHDHIPGTDHIGSTDRITNTDATGDHGRTARHTPVRVLPLPRRVDHDALRRDASEAIGIGGDGAVPVVLPVSRGALVVGPRGSGRTTTLRLLLRTLPPADSSVVIARDRALTADAARLGARVEPPTPAALRAVLDELDARAGSGPVRRPSGPRPSTPQVLLIDDADTLVQAAPIESDLLAQRAADGLVTVIASATTLAAGIAHRGLLAQLRAVRTGIVLAPAERGADEVFATALDDAVEPGVRLPGRGAIVADGVVSAIQLATPPSTEATSITDATTTSEAATTSEATATTEATTTNGETDAVSAAWLPRPRAA